MLVVWEVTPLHGKILSIDQQCVQTHIFSVTIDNSADSTLIILAEKKKEILFFINAPITFLNVSLAYLGNIMHP